MKVVLLLLCMSMFAISCHAESNKPTAYLCIPTDATGFKFKGGKWQPTNFSVADVKWVLKSHNSDWYWNEFGMDTQSEHTRCNSSGDSPELGFLKCNSYGKESIFNNKTLRYQLVNPSGYVVSNTEIDTKGYSPHMEIGSCTPL